MSGLPVVCVFGKQGIKLVSPPAPPFETREMDVRCYLDDTNLNVILAKDRPSAIVSFGDVQSYKYLLGSPEFVRRMWFHFEDDKNLNDIGSKVFSGFFFNATKAVCDKPLVSVITPTFKTGDKIERPFRSLLAQTHLEWEWVIMDDSDDNGETFKRLSSIAEQDNRIRVYRESRHSGRIGTVKRSACGLARGKYIVELDHDDALTPNALKWVVDAFDAHPEAGFAYSDFAECSEDGTPWTYGNGWGLGYGSYREEMHGDIKYMVVNSPNVNAKTIRHIVAAPNHLRAWRKSFYDSIDGHRDLFHVVDDYELMVRTFLSTRMIRIPRLCYVQYRNQDGSGNTSLGVRNKEIQRLVRYVSLTYDKQIHERLLELGVDDFVWQEGMPSFYRLLRVQNPLVESHCTITYEPVS